MGMYIWYGFLITMGFLQAVYFVFRIKRFYVVKKISKGNKWVSTGIALVPVLILIIYGIKHMVPTVIVTMYLMITWMICDLIGIILRKITKKTFKVYVAGIIALVLTCAFFTHAYVYAHHIVKTEALVETDKNAFDKLRVALVTDSHIGTMFDGKGFGKITKDIMKSQPDIVLIGGDYVDDDTEKKDMIEATKALGQMKPKYGVYMVMGNHDDAYFHYRDFSTKDLKNELKKNNVVLLEDKVKKISNDFYLVGRKDKSSKNRKSASELMKGIDTNKSYSIILDHQPNDFDAEALAKPDLVLCGHTHGGQLFPLGLSTEIAKTNDLRYGYEKRGKTTFFVSSGIAGWGMPFKDEAPSEYVIVDVNKK